MVREICGFWGAETQELMQKINKEAEMIKESAFVIIKVFLFMVFTFFLKADIQSN